MEFQSSSDQTFNLIESTLALKYFRAISGMHSTLIPANKLQGTANK